MPTAKRASIASALLLLTLAATTSPTTAPATASAWHPEPGHLMTRWAKDVDPAAPLPEYPRPQMVRRDWLNLNGLWDYAVTGKRCDGRRRRRTTANCSYRSRSSRPCPG